jgi:hypothetical protein
MAAESNGRPVEPGQKGMNGSAKAPRSKPVKAAKGFSLFSTISRQVPVLLGVIQKTNRSVDFSHGIPSSQY